MEILNDLTKCNFYYYILRSNKAYLIYKYLQLNQNSFNCVGDAFIRWQNIKVDNSVVRFLNKNLKQQYNLWKKFKELKSRQKIDFRQKIISIQDIDLGQKLIEYSQSGYLLIVKYLVDKGFNSQLVFANALLLAAEYGHLNIVQYLVSKGANIRTDYVYLALIKATRNGHLQIVQYLVSKGANINAEYDDTLIWAAKNGHLKIVQYLLQPNRLNNFLNRKYEGSNIHGRNDSALGWAAENGNLPVVHYLVSKGADIHAVDDYALYYAAQNGHLPVVQYLVSVGANPNKLTSKQKAEFNIN